MKNNAADRILEEKLYDKTIEEIEGDVFRQGLWAKALLESGGNENLARQIYVRLRVQSMKDEIKIKKEADTKNYIIKKVKQVLIICFFLFLLLIFFIFLLEEVFHV
jgi:hypothetical protein